MERQVADAHEGGVEPRLDLRIAGEDAHLAFLSLGRRLEPHLAAAGQHQAGDPLVGVDREDHPVDEPQLQVFGPNGEVFGAELAGRIQRQAVEVLDGGDPFFVGDPPLAVVDAFDVELPAGDPRAVAGFDEDVDEHVVAEARQRTGERLPITLDHDGAGYPRPELERHEILRPRLVGRGREQSEVSRAVVGAERSLDSAEHRSDAPFVVRLDGDGPALLQQHRAKNGRRKAPCFHGLGKIRPLY